MSSSTDIFQHVKALSLAYPSRFSMSLMFEFSFQHRHSVILKVLACVNEFSIGDNEAYSCLATKLLIHGVIRMGYHTVVI